VVERWWAQDSTRGAYVQVAVRDGLAVLASFSGGAWVLEAVYD
jgi:protein ImuB